MQIIHSNENNILVPAVVNTKASPRVSSRYNFLHTESVVDALKARDYVVTNSQQQISRKNLGDFGVHLVRMRHERDINTSKGLVPEIIIRNSHDGHRALEMMSGMFRMVCANGIITGEVDSAVKIRHSRNNDMEAVFDGVKWVVEKSERAILKSEAWAKIEMTDLMLRDFAKKASLIVRKNDDALSPEELFAQKYDEPRNLWTAYNLAQERLIRGGIGINRNEESRARKHLRPITAVSKTVDINRQLWAIAEEYAA